MMGRPEEGHHGGGGEAPDRRLVRWRMVVGRLWPLLLPLLLYLPSLGKVPFPAGGVRFSDLAVAHIPYLITLRRSLAVWGQVPLWAPNILSGAPLAANPLAGLWYPPGWLALMLPIPWGFNLLVMVHVLWGGLGMLMLLRREGCSWEAALVGALAFEGLPKLMAHYGAGHVTLVYAVAWTPWLLVVEGWGERGRWWGRWFSPGVVLALIFLADVRWAPPAGLLWFFWSFAHSHVGEPGRATGRERKRWLLRQLRWLVGQVLLAVGLAAPLALPLLEFTRLSTRARMTPQDVLDFSLPPARLLGLLFPDFGGFHEWVLYPGAVLLTLAVIGALQARTNCIARFWSLVTALALLYSLGKHIPGLHWLAGLPGFDVLRVPPRVLFLAAIGLAVLAALGVDRLLTSRDLPASPASLLSVTALGAFSLVMTAGVRLLTGSWQPNFVWGALMVVATWLLVQLRARLTARVWYGALLGLCLLDWAVIDRSLLDPRPVELVFAEGEAVARYLASQQGIFRVYSPSYSLPQHTAARYGLELADGVDPLQLATYADFMARATGVPVGGYSVTLPPFATGNPRVDNAAYRPHPQLLGLLNVRYVVAEFDLQVDDLVWRAQFGTSRVYENLAARPRAWVQETQGGAQSPAWIVSWKPNRIEVQAAGPGTLVLSEIAYPGWEVRVDGRPADLQTVEGLLRGVALEAGVHQVVFGYRPASLLAGGILSLLAALALLLWPAR